MFLLLFFVFLLSPISGEQPTTISELDLAAINREMPSILIQARKDLVLSIHAEASHAKSSRNTGERSSPNHMSSFKFLLDVLGSSPYVKQMSYPSFVQTRAMHIIRDRYRLNNHQVQDFFQKSPAMLLSNADVFTPDSPFPTPLPNYCPYPQNVICDPNYIFRSIDGTCNNVRYPLWGSSNKPFDRLLPPLYGDAISFPRVSVSGHLLPSARLVSATVHWDRSRPHSACTLATMTFGQFYDHDFSRTAVVTLEVLDDGYGNQMADVECGRSGCDTRGDENRACLPIAVPSNDTDYAAPPEFRGHHGGHHHGGHHHGGKPCLTFVRSQQVPATYDCRLGPPEQLNQVTSYIDASHIYGSTMADSLKLRELSPVRGRLKMAKSNYGAKDLLPNDPKFKHCKTGRGRCFGAGDSRVNEHVGLMCLHTLMAREHNRIEVYFHHINPHWDGERLFQETRRLVAAIVQHTLYNEWLPVVLGPREIHQHNLKLTQRGYWNGYNSDVKADIVNSFATAAFRFGHSLIQGDLDLVDNSYNTLKVIKLSETYRNPSLIYERPEFGMDSLIMGLVRKPSQSPDVFISKEISKHLFADDVPSGLGEDLMSLNIQRGRDHGLPGYNYFREKCGLRRAFNFRDFSSEIPLSVIKRFQRLYKHVDDVDLWPAGIAETPTRGAMVGPTFSCIIAGQFSRLRQSDSHWYENQAGNPYPFTLDQLSEIRKASNARLLCDNTDTVVEVQPFVFLQPIRRILANLGDDYSVGDLDTVKHLTSGSDNDVRPCSSLPAINLDAWIEKPSF